MSVYGFKQDFIKPDPRENPEIFLGPRKSSAQKIANEVTTTVKSGRPSKMVIYGLFGIGKTHLATNVMQRVHDTVVPYYLECPSCHRRSRFIELESAMMRKIGKSAFMKNLRSCIEEFDGRIADIENLLGIDADFAEVLKKGLEENETLLWRYLLGQKLNSTQMITLSAVKPQLDDLDASKIISITAKLFSKYEQKKILFIIDEMEKTSPLMGDSLTAYRDAIRDLMDNNNSANILMISTAREMDDFRLLNDDPVKRRIGLNNFKFFKPYNDDELLELMKEVIQIQRKKDFSVNNINKLSSQEKIDEKTYPFTEKALVEIIEYVHYLVDNNIGGIPAVRPNELFQLIDLCLTKSQEKNLELIDSKFVKTVENEFTTASTPGII